jgi:hypothetical protein
MNNFFSRCYTKLLPYALRAPIYQIRFEYDLRKLKKRIFKYYSKLPYQVITNEEKEVLKFLEVHSVTNIPYDFQFEYDPESIIVQTDDQSGLKYTIYDNKKLFFKRSWSEEKIRNYFNELLIEQDIRSPHLYLTNDFSITEEATVADVGAAEGNFSLSVVENVKSLYLFEADSEWIEALTETFAPWKYKVTIINKMVSNLDDSEHISLDVFFEKKATLSFLKIDVDGAEKVVIEGAEKILTEQNPLQIALCTYHKQEDEGIYTSLLNKKGFEVEASKGFMIFINGGLKFLNKPFFRRGLIRASKQN